MKMEVQNFPLAAQTPFGLIPLCQLQDLMANVTLSTDAPNPDRFDQMGDDMHAIEGADHFAIGKQVVNKKVAANAFPRTVEELAPPLRDAGMALIAELMFSGFSVIDFNETPTKFAAAFEVAARFSDVFIYGRQDVAVIVRADVPTPPAPSTLPPLSNLN